MSIVRRHLSAVVALVVAVAACPPALATDDDMAQLPPVVNPFECLLCHTQDGSSELNTFGVDFLANAHVWDATLAALDSDDDGCVNGVELGDADGDGVNDGNVEELQSNPGVTGDCGEATVDSRTWGDLKALFDRR